MEGIRDKIGEIVPDALFMDGYDDCIIGVVSRQRMDTVALYDQDAVIQKLMNDGTPEEEAQEFFEYNQIGGWYGDKTPCFMQFTLSRRGGMVGVARRYGMDDVGLYDRLLVINKLVADGMTKRQAVAKISVWRGSRTPCYMEFILPEHDGCLSVVMEKEIRSKKNLKKVVAKKNNWVYIPFH